MGFSSGSRSPRASLNVTPLVDVVLVLLIIFMVAMPVALIRTPLEVPAEGEMGGESFAVITIVGAADGSLRIDASDGSTNITRIDLARELRPRLSAERTNLVFIDFDDASPYTDVVSVIDTVRGAAKRTPGIRIAMTIRPRDRESMD